MRTAKTSSFGKKKSAPPAAPLKKKSTSMVAKVKKSSRSTDDEVEPKAEAVEIWTPAGRFSYPKVAFPEDREEFGAGQYTCDLLITKADFKLKGSALKEAVLKVGKAKWKDFDLKSGKYNTPFKDTDTDDKIEDERQLGCILIKAKAYVAKKTGRATQPDVIGPRKDPETGAWVRFDQEEMEGIKGGDWGRLYVSVFAYDTRGSMGVAFGLISLQFWKEGEAFGQGRSAHLDSAEEFDEELEDIDGDESETEEEDEAPVKRKGKKNVEEESEDEEFEEVEDTDDEEDEEEELPRSKGRKSSKRVVDEDEDDVI